MCSGLIAGRAAAGGSLRGKLVAAQDWDGDEVNAAIARAFGVTS